MKKIWTTEEEAANLRKLFELREITNKAAFVRKYGIPGGSSMLFQHITGRSPISLEAATKYAKGLGVSLVEISPRLAEETAQVLSIMPIVPTNEQALEAFIDTLRKQTPENRENLHKPLTALLYAPDSAEAKARVLAVLENS